MGVWIPLEDVHPDSGPLVGIPESHKFPIVDYNYLNLELPKTNKNFGKKEINPKDISSNNLFLLKNENCFRNSIENFFINDKTFQENFNLKTGSFETLINLVDKGLGITLLPYLYTLKLSAQQRKMLHNFKNPKPAREVSLVYNKNEIKIHIINEIKDLIKQLIKTKLQFNDVNIISPIKKRKRLHENCK